jgi:hypothetical protein
MKNQGHQVYQGKNFIAFPLYPSCPFYLKGEINEQ